MSSFLVIVKSHLFPQFVHLEHYPEAKSLNYAQTTEQSNADKSRLDREDCLSDSIVSVAKRAGTGSAVLVLPCRNCATAPS